MPQLNTFPAKFFIVSGSGAPCPFEAKAWTHGLFKSLSIVGAFSEAVLRELHSLHALDLTVQGAGAVIVAQSTSEFSFRLCRAEFACGLFNSSLQCC